MDGVMPKVSMLVFLLFVTKFFDIYPVNNIIIIIITNTCFGFFY